MGKAGLQHLVHLVIVARQLVSRLSIGVVGWNDSLALAGEGSCFAAGCKETVCLCFWSERRGITDNRV